jgi:hypothetical protein
MRKAAANAAVGRLTLLPALVLVGSALLACKLGKGGDGDRPLPTVGVPVPSGAAVPVSQPGAASEPPRPAAPVATAAPAATVEPEPAATATATARPPAVATATADAAAPSTTAAPATTPDAGDSLNRAAQCLNRCQTLFQQCMATQPEGGLPDLSRCQGMLEGCRVACS